MSVKGSHRMTITESLRRRVAARRSMTQARRDARLAEIRRQRDLRRLAKLLVGMEHRVF